MIWLRGIGTDGLFTRKLHVPGALRDSKGGTWSRCGQVRVAIGVDIPIGVNRFCGQCERFAKKKP